MRKDIRGKKERKKRCGGSVKGTHLHMHPRQEEIDTALEVDCYYAIMAVFS